MARPIKETPVLKGEDAFNFEWQRLMVENRTPEERAEKRRKKTTTHASCSST